MNCSSCKRLATVLAEDEEENVEPLCDDCYHEMQRTKPLDRGPGNVTTEKGEGDHESP